MAQQFFTDINTGLECKTIIDGNFTELYGVINNIGSTNQNQTITNATYNYTKITLTGATIQITISDLASTVVRTIFIELTQDGTGGRLVTWAGNIQWPGGVLPVLSSTLNAKDLFIFQWNGTKYQLIGTSYNLS